MTVYTVIFHQRLDNYAVVQTLGNNTLELGTSFTLAGLGHNLNGTHTVRDLPQLRFIGVDGVTGELMFEDIPTPNQVMFYDEGDDLQWSAALPTGTLTYAPTCTWITAQQILDWLGIAVATAADQAFVTQCAAASNAFCFRRRQEAGYSQDSLTTVPSGDVALGAIQYGGMLYRQRGSIDSFAQFDNAQAPVIGLSGVIKQLLGIDRPQVA